MPARDNLRPSERAANLAEKIMSGERMALETQGLANLFKDELMLSIELQFLWGVFHEFVREYTCLPANSFVRIQIHLIQRLMSVHGYCFEAARDEAIAIDGLYNKGDELFDAVSDLGKEAFHNPQNRYLPFVVKSLQKTARVPMRTEREK